MARVVARRGLLAAVLGIICCGLHSPRALGAGEDFLKFTNTLIDNTSLGNLTSVEVGPDRNVYASSQFGKIFRWQIDPATGLATGPRELLYTVPGIPNQDFNSALTGITFDPASTPNNLIMWTAENLGGNFDGAISRLVLPSVGSGAAVVQQDYIKGLIRGGVGEAVNHQTNGITFGPDGKMYIAQGSYSPAGSQEYPLSAAILRADVNAPGFLNAGQAVNVDTNLGYDPNVPGAKVTVFATGTRNPYDLVWHSNGNLYAGVNGNDSPDALPDDPDTAFNESTVAGGRPDEAFLLLRQGQFYGHPNPSRGQYIAFAGNPTPGTGNDGNWEIPGYPAGTQPEPGWTPSDMYDLITATGATSLSPDGIAEYTANNGLQKRVLMAQYSQTQSIGSVKLDASGHAIAYDALVNATTGTNLIFSNPLDLAVDRISGRIYVAAYATPGSSGQLRMLDPFVKPTAALKLQVNLGTGAVSIVNTDGTGTPVNLNQYAVGSPGGKLVPANWAKLAPNGGWATVTSTTSQLSEANASSSTAVGGSPLGLGAVFTPVVGPFGTLPTGDLTFTFTLIAGTATPASVEYVGKPAFVNNLLLRVDPMTGQALLTNDSQTTISIDYYGVFSALNALKPNNGDWNSLADQLVPGWQEASPTTHVLSELNPTGSLQMLPGATKALGGLFNAAGAHDLTLQFTLAGQAAMNGVVQYRLAADFDNDGDVDGDDLTTWKSAFGASAAADADGDGDSDGADLIVWQRELGAVASELAASGTVPEPSGIALMVSVVAILIPLVRRQFSARVLA